jgi:5-aminolevulinate synthase
MKSPQNFPMQLEIVVTAVQKCPYLQRTSVNKLRKLSTTNSSTISSPNALFSIARKCPMMKNALKQRLASISTSTKCPYASIVDNISVVGTAGKLADYLKKPGIRLLMIESFPASYQENSKFDYESFYNQELEKKKNDRSYRYFNNINRLAKMFPMAHTGTGEHVNVWCSNDYLGMSKHPSVIEAMK